jgi:hypothetical protein
MSQQQLKLSDLLNGTYSSTTEYHYDLKLAGSDGVLIQAAGDKLERSMSTIKGAQVARTNAQKNVSVQLFADGSAVVGSAADVAAARNEKVNQSNAATKQAAGSLQKFLSVQVKK